WRVFDQAAGFRSSSMNYMIARRDGRLCTSYFEALGLTCFRYDGRTVEQFEHVRPADGLSAGMVYFLGEDREARLWVGTGNGVDVVTPQAIASPGSAGVRRTPEGSAESIASPGSAGVRRTPEGSAESIASPGSAGVRRTPEGSAE